MEHKDNFLKFLSVIDQLRSENGCPWDKVQTHESLKTCMIEEAYEVVEGIDEYTRTKDYDNLREELGDVLLQVVMHCSIAKEEGLFTIDDVINEITEKMIRRHPHVFGTVEANTSEDVVKNWEEIKKIEKQTKKRPDTLASIPVAFPALIRAQKVIKKQQKIDPCENFCLPEEWFHKKVDTIKEKGIAEHEKEVALGQVLFELCGLAQKEKLNAEKCLSEYTKSFIWTKEEQQV